MHLESYKDAHDFAYISGNIRFFISSFCLSAFGSNQPTTLSNTDLRISPDGRFLIPMVQDALGKENPFNFIIIFW